MRDGEYTLYCIQFLTIAETPWDKPKHSLKPLKKKGDFGFCGDNWEPSLNPHIGKGNDWRAKNKLAGEQWHYTFIATGHHGWWDLKYAAAALQRVQADDVEGKFDYKDHGSGRLMQRRRHQFRIVKITAMHKTEPVTVQDFVAAA